MRLRDKNLITLYTALKGVTLTHEEIQSLTWLAGYEPSTINNIASAICKAVNAGGINILPFPQKPDDKPDKWHAQSNEKPQSITWRQIPKAL